MKIALTPPGHFCDKAADEAAGEGFNKRVTCPHRLPSPQH